MRRILVPLDGSAFAESILPDARRFLSEDGELILAYDAHWVRYEPKTGKYTHESAIQTARGYLDTVANALRADGIRVATQRLLPYDIPWAIDVAAQREKVDMIACATHGRGPFGRFLRGSVAWKALTHSVVPVLLRHPEADPDTVPRHAEPARRKILVPLDGSQLAEAALPLARQLAHQWSASIWLIQIVLDIWVQVSPYRRAHISPEDPEAEIASAQAYLRSHAARCDVETHTEAFLATDVGNGLVKAVRNWEVTDIVMTSHGRTGLSRVILGSVADDLVQHLHIPILIIPALAAERELTRGEGTRITVSAASR